MLMRNGAARARNRKPELKRETYVPAHLIRLANRLSRGASRLYLKLFGVGVIEWRILSILAIEGQSTANIICKRIDLDKAAASRSIRHLKSKGYIEIGPDANDARKQCIVLTVAGAKLHDAILPVALKRQHLLLKGFSAEERKQLLSYLGRLLANMEEIDSHAVELSRKPKA